MMVRSPEVKLSRIAIYVRTSAAEPSVRDWNVIVYFRLLLLRPIYKLRISLAVVHVGIILWHVCSTKVISVLVRVSVRYSQKHSYSLMVGTLGY